MLNIKVGSKKHL